MTFGKQSTAEEVTEGLDLTGQHWLVTGVNSGLGYETARVLGARGASIVGLARTEAKARGALDELGLQGIAVACELSDLDSVRGSIEAVRAGVPALNGIIANAGIMALPELRQVRGLELQFATNHVGHHLLVSRLAEHLAPKSRVVMLSSGAHFLAKRGMELDNLDGSTDYEAWRMYGRSKLANILFARALSTRLSGGSTANAVHPGVIRTNLARHVPDAEGMLERLKDRMKTIPQGAATQCYVAVHPSVGRTTGAYFADCAVAKTLDAARDDELAEQLWTVTEGLIEA